MRRILQRSRLLCQPSLGYRFNSAASTPPPPSPPKVSKSDVDDVVALFEKHPELIPNVLNAMTPENRRKLVVTGGAYEWFGEASVAAEVQLADFDKDRVISPKDFDKWFEEAIRRKSTSSATEESTPLPAGASTAASIPTSVLLLVALEAGLPFVGFGFLDNATMILAGDAIDRSVGLYFNTTVMASAAMGNVVSGCMGMQVHGFVEKLVQKLNLPIPPLTEEQRRSQRVFLAGHLGGTFGVACGLMLGMLPLLWVGDEDEKNEHRVFRFLDTDGDGKLSEAELRQAIIELGLPTPATAKVLIEKHGSGGVMTLEQFQTMCSHVKQHGAKASAAA